MDDINWKVTAEMSAGYIQVCKDAAGNNSVFDSFKSDKRINRILEHCPLTNALHLYIQIQRDNPDLLKDTRLFENDLYGGAFKQNIFDIISSTSTMQYIAVLSDLIKHFGSLDKKNIIEIGAGYGGQAMVIMNKFKVKSYTIIDLPGVTDLQKRYLKTRNVLFYNSDYPKNKKYDLVISNYALSEVAQPTQNEYIQDVLHKSKHGYITANLPMDLAIFPSHKTKSDVRATCDDNIIIYW